MVLRNVVGRGGGLVRESSDNGFVQEILIRAFNIITNYSSVIEV